MSQDSLRALAIQQLHELTHEAIIGVALFILLFFFRSSLENMIAGIIWKIGRTYNVDDVVKINGDWARIVRQNIWTTSFYVYHIVKGKIVGGFTMNVANNQLRELKILKPLTMIDIPANLRNIHRY